MAEEINTEQNMNEPPVEVIPQAQGQQQLQEKEKTIEPVEENQEKAETQEIDTEEKKKEIAEKKQKFNWRSIPEKLMNIMREYRRVIIISKKPDFDELIKIFKVAGLGMIIIGLIGFIIQIIFRLLVGGV